MRNFVASDGPPHNGPDQSTPLSHVQELRMQIGKMADCLTRMLDMASDEEGVAISTPYLFRQLDHLCGAYTEAVKLVWYIEKAKTANVAAALGLEAGELQELAGAPTKPIAEIGGGA